MWPKIDPKADPEAEAPNELLEELKALLDELLNELLNLDTLLLKLDVVATTGRTAKDTNLRALAANLGVLCFIQELNPPHPFPHLNISFLDFFLSFAASFLTTSFF